MTRTIILTLALALLTGVAIAADNDNITVNYVLSAIKDIEFNEASVSLDINSSTDGEYDSSMASTTYDYSCNSETSQKITATLNSDVAETGITLHVQIDKPSDGVMGTLYDISNGFTAGVVVATAISATSASALDINFSLEATTAATAFSSTNKVCTFTVADVS